MAKEKNENHEESASFKVNDQRNFNPDGSAREKETLEAAAELPTDQGNPAEEPTEEPTKAPSPSEVPDTGPSLGAEIPAEFSTLVLTLASSAQSALGVAPDPMSGQVQVNLSQAKHMIDLLGMLESKTQGNLSAEEAQLLQAVLSDLRMRFVEIKKENHGQK